VSVWIARAIALIYVGIIPLFMLNWRLIRKLRQAAQMRTRLAPSWRRRVTDQFKARRRSHRLANVATFALCLLGYLVVTLGLIGLLFELVPGPFSSPRAILYATASVFGLSCISLQFIARGREQLQVIAELRSSLLADRSASESRLTGEDYDEITRLERGQIASDRRRSFRAASSDGSLERTYSAKEHRGVRDAKLSLAPEILVRVQACIDRLTLRTGAVASATQARDGISYMRVPDTPLEIGFRVDTAAREIRVLSLGPASPGVTPTQSDGSDGR
jgi:hypothetical protein